MKKQSPEDLGFVYVMANPAMPDLVKIGKTARVPDGRARELQSTGVPTSFEIIYFGMFECHSFVEQKAHRTLSAERETENREFFRVKSEVAVAAIRSAAGTPAVYEFLTELDEAKLAARQSAQKQGEAAEQALTDRCDTFRTDLEKARHLKLGPSGFRLGRQIINVPFIVEIDPKPFGSVLGGLARSNDHGEMRQEAFDDYWETNKEGKFKLRAATESDIHGWSFGLKKRRFVAILIEIPGERRRVRWTLEGEALKRWKIFVSENYFQRRGWVCVDLEWPTKRSPLPRFSLSDLGEDAHRLGR